MKLPFTRRRKNLGIYGGFGSKAADEAWRPSRQHRSKKSEGARKRWRFVRIRRARWKPDPLTAVNTATPGTILLAFMLLVIVLLVSILS